MRQRGLGYILWRRVFAIHTRRKIQAGFAEKALHKAGYGVEERAART